MASGDTPNGAHPHNGLPTVIRAALASVLAAVCLAGCGGGNGGDSADGGAVTTAPVVTGPVQRVHVPDLVGLPPDVAFGWICSARLAIGLPEVVSAPASGAT